MISIIIPANNEEGYIGPCLDLILSSQAPGPDAPGQPALQVIVAANGCDDGTVAETQSRRAAFVEKGWQLDVLDLSEGGKIGALNASDAIALYGRRIYIDADIQVTPELIAQLARALETADPVYASGRPRVPPAKSYISRRYARFWEKLPFIAEQVPGCGVFAVNAAGRARWGAFPDIISDDTFVRFHFSRDEMHGVSATYAWPITEGFANLVRVRRRQDEGLEEMRRLYPDLARQTQVTAPGGGKKLRLFLRDPVGFMIYAAVAITVRLPVLRNRSAWDRGR